jgi:RimJ/RimL family protein N-acetyltransferase
VNRSQPVGESLDWEPRRAPEPVALRGQNVLLRPLEPRADAQRLYVESHPPAADAGLWTYLPAGPYRDARDLGEALSTMAVSRDPLFFAVVTGGNPAGVTSYLRITPEHGVIEIGHIWFGASLQRTTAASEAIYLLAAHAFDALGYRRLEWKCDALNAPSRRAAERFGFRFEGVFKQHMVVKGRNRDTAWFAITDDEWPAVRAGFRAWLAPPNFDPGGRQRQRLSDLVTQARDRVATPARACAGSPGPLAGTGADESGADLAGRRAE